MALAADLRAKVADILSTPWSERDGRVVPESKDVAMSGGAVKLDAVVLYADLARSTELAWKFQPKTAAKILKCYLYCCSRIIVGNSGAITSFDGDRVMGIFLGDLKNTNATKAALQINWAVKEIVKPSAEKQFTALAAKGFTIAHAVGIDTSEVLAVRAGMRDNNDLIWIGRAPGIAAKLSNVREARYRSYITADVYKMAAESSKIASDKRAMWEKWTGDVYGLEIYRSEWSMTIP